MTPLTAPRLYGIADCGVLGASALPKAVATMASQGIGWVQVRAKSLASRELFDLIGDCCRRVEGTKTALWIDDRVDLAVLFPVAGVHLGQGDLPPSQAREILGPDVWIGRSTHNLAQVEEADVDAAVDVVAVGPVFPTRSKKRPDPVVGIDGIRRARQKTRKPLVAIGGLEVSNLRETLAAGADSAAMIGAFCNGDIANNCVRLLAVAEEEAS